AHRSERALRAEICEGAVGNRVGGDAGKKERHPSSLLLVCTPDGEDEDRADQDVADRVGQVENPGGTVGQPYRLQPERPRGRRQSEGDDDSVEPDAPARRRPTRGTPECPYATDGKRNGREEGHGGKRGIWRLDVQAHLVDGPHDFARGP